MSPGTTAPEELELKFSIPDAAAARRWIDETFPRKPGERWRTLNIVDRYFDTADQRLAAAGYGVRLRRVRGRTVLTVKADLEVGDGRHRRLELEAPATRTLDWRRWPPSEARARVEEVAGTAPLIESFVVQARRRERDLSIAGARVVTSVDDATVEWCGVPAGELRQVEFELAEGTPDALDALSSRAVTSGLEPESRSKLAMAAALVPGAQRIQVSDALVEAGRKYLRRQLLRMLEREQGLRAGDPEALRQMRVATRRMRAAWRVFGAGFRGRERVRHVDELRRVAQALGEVRDMDVLLGRLPKREVLEPLAATWRAQREEAWERALTLLDGSDYRRFVRDYLELTGRRGFGISSRRASITVDEALPEVLRRAIARLRDAEAAARGSTDDTLWHELRIRAKRLRYTLESMREVVHERAATATVESLRGLQDVLGEMNDAAVAARAAEAWLQAEPDAPETARRAVDRFVVACQASVERQRELFDAAWTATAQALDPEALTQR